MNAVPPVLQAQPSSGPVQPNPSDSAASAPPRAGSQDFASALNDAGGRPARKNAANKHQDSAVNGSSLPPPGNQPPPAQSSASPAKSAAAAVADAPVAANGPPGSAQGSVPTDVASASTTRPNSTDAATILTAENLDTAAAAAAAAQAPAAPPAFEAPPSLAARPALAPGVEATTPSAADAPSAPASGPTMPHAAGTRILATPGTSKAPTVPEAPAGSAAKLGVDTTNPGTPASANSKTSSADAGALTDSTSSSGPAAAGTDAAAQAAMATAIAQGTNATAPDSTFADDLASSDGDLPSGAAAVSGPAGALAGGAPGAGATAAALAQASAAAVSAAVTAASAASVAQAISATAGAGAADKRSHGNSPDSTLSGASNDGSVGAAQLLTSNAPTDSAPTPTFKVAAGVDTAQFGQGVVDRVSAMMDGNLTSAKLQVNPPALGPIEVRIALQGGHAQVSFSSHSAVTRDALESSSEKLREMLGSQGFSSVSVDISHRSFQERSPPSQAYESAPSVGGDASVLAQAPRSMARSASGLLDAYA